MFRFRSSRAVRAVLLWLAVAGAAVGVPVVAAGVRVFDSHPGCGPGPLARTACAAAEPPSSPTGTDAATGDPPVTSSPSPSPSTPPEPEFEEFPEPVEPTAPSSDDVPGMVEIDGTEGDADTTRIVVVSVAGVVVLGTLGLFARTVLFGVPWVPGRDEDDPS